MSESDDSLNCGGSIDELTKTKEVDEKFLKSNTDNLSQITCIYSLYNRQVSKSLLDNLANTEGFAKDCLDASATYYLIDSEVNNFKNLLNLYNKADLDFNPSVTLSNIDWSQVGRIQKDEKNKDNKNVNNSSMSSFINKMDNLDLSGVPKKDVSNISSFTSRMDVLTLNSIYLSQKKARAEEKQAIKTIVKDNRTKEAPKELKETPQPQKSFYDEFFELEAKLRSRSINLKEEEEEDQK